MTETWHADEDMLRAWAGGRAAAVLAASLEAHLLRCPECRGRMVEVVGGRNGAETVRRWHALAEEIDRPRAHPLARVGLSTPGLRAAWSAALLMMLLLPAVITVAGGRLPLMLAVAPLAPLAAVALAYGRASEPAGELALAAPAAGLRLVAARALLVSLPAVPLGVGTALVLDLPHGAALGWLLPGAALAAVVLCVGTTRFDPAAVAAGLGALWAVGVSSPSAVRRVPAEVVTGVLASPPAQLTALAVALGAIALTVARRDAVAYRRTA